MIFQNFWTSLETPIHRAYFVIALAAALLSFLVCALLIKKYLNKKTSLKLKAAGAIFLFGIAVILDPIYLALRAYANYDRVGLQSNISFGIMGYANIVLLVFLREVFYKSEYNWKVYLLIVAEASILPVALALYYAKIDTIYILVVHLLASFVIYLSQYLQSRNL